jgi:6-phosphogluconolactonase (cycloisomerase 2 family)
MWRGIRLWTLILLGCLTVLVGCGGGSLGTSENSSNSSGGGGLFGLTTSSENSGPALASLTIELNPGFPDVGRVLSNTTQMVIDVEVPATQQLAAPSSVSSRPPGLQQFDISIDNIQLFPGGDSTVRVEVFGLDDNNHVNDYAVFNFPLQPGRNFAATSLGPPPQPPPNPFPEGIPSSSPSPSPSSSGTPPQATALAFLVQPTATTANQVITPPVQVAIVDANGNVVSNATNAITLVATAGSSTTPVDVAGSPSVTVNAVNGVATFNNLSIAQQGAGYILTATSPGLTPATSQSFDINAAPPGLPFALRFDATGHFLYVGNSALGSISIYAFDPTTGNMSPIPGSPFATGDTNVGDIAVKTGSGGNPNIVYGIGNSGLVGVVHNPATGQVTAIPSALSAPVGPGQFRLGFDSTGSFLYVTNENGISGTTVSEFSVAADGTLTQLPGSPLGGFNSPVTVVAVNNFVYITNSLNAGSIAPELVNPNGTLTAIQAPLPNEGNGNLPSDGTITPNGQFVYVANQGSGNISAWQIAGSGTLSPVRAAPFATTQGSAFWPAVEHNGQFLYLCENNHFNKPSIIEGYSIAANGILTQLPNPTQVSANNSFELQANPAGPYLAIANTDDSTIGVYLVNANGSLTQVAGSPFADRRHTH